MCGGAHGSGLESRGWPFLIPHAPRAARRRARVRGEPEFRDRDAAVLRGREVGRDEWKPEAGYHRRSLAETAMMRLKVIFSDRLKSRAWKRQETELRLRCAALNRMTGLGMPQSYAV